MVPRNLLLLLVTATCGSMAIAGCLDSSPAPSAAGVAASNSVGIEREPDYQSAPLYGKIAIGLNRDREFWTVSDLVAGVIYVDLNGNGDLTEAAEALALNESTKIKETRFWSALIPEIKQGDDVHTNLKVKLAQTGNDIKFDVSLMLWGWDESTTGADLVPLRFATDPGQAPTVHFNGPLTMGAYRSRAELAKGREVDFYSLIGTQGFGSGTLTAITNSEIPEDAYPKAEFEFPHRDPAQPPLKITTFLTTRC